MKIKFIAISLALIAASSAQSQGFLGKLLKGTSSSSTTATKINAPVLMENLPDEFSDEFGYSGTYFSLDTLWKMDSYDRLEEDDDGNTQYALTQKWKFERENGGNIVNRLFRYTGTARSMNSLDLILDEKLKEKSNLTVFSGEVYNQFYFLMMLEEGVYGLAKVKKYDLIVLEYLNTYAKDQSKLADYDKETGAAVMQSLINKAKLEKINAERTKWQRNETYVKMKGKIGFIDHYGKVAYNKGDITEKVDVFMSSVEIGKTSIFYRAYYDTPGNVLCAGCELNTTYEINGIKVSRVELRKKSSSWSYKIKQKFTSDDFFSAEPIMISYQENIMDYALLYCIYQNKDKFTNGKSIPLKVTITTNQDGIDKDVLAESTITLVYKDANKAGFDKLIKIIDDFLEQ
jgi:hypothetical protein